MRFLNQKLYKGFGSFMLSNSFLFFSFIFGCTRSWLLHTGFLQLQRVGTTLQLWGAGFSLRWLLLLQSMGSRVSRLQKLQHLGSSGCATWAQHLWCAGLVAPRQVEPSQTRDGTSVPCSGRQIHEAVLQYLWETEDRQTPQLLSYIVNGLSCFLSKKDFSLSWSGSFTESVTYTKASQKSL